MDPWPRALFALPRRLALPAALVRQALSGDVRAQLAKLFVLARHREEHGRLRRSLVEFRAILALLLAHRLGVLRALRLPATPAQVAARCGIREGAARSLARILEAQGLVAAQGERFALTPFALEFVAPDGAVTLEPLLELLATFTSSFDDLTASVRAGEVAPSLDALRAGGNPDPFLDAVNSYLDAAGRELFARIELPPVERLIAGSMGVSLSALVLSLHPRSRVTYGCLPHLVERIPRLRARYGVDPARVDGMHHHGGDPEQDRWGDERFDLVLLTKKLVLAPEARLGERFVRKAFQVLRPGGVALLWEAVQPDRGPAGLALATEAFLDLGVSPTGCLLTRGGLARMLGEIGYEPPEVVPCLGGETTFVVARRPR